MSDGELGTNISQGSLPPQDQSKFPGRKGHRKSLLQSTMAESMKLKLMRAKAIRETQKERIDPRHQYIFSYVADCLKLDPSVVADFMLDGDQVESCCLFTYIILNFYYSWTYLMNFSLPTVADLFCFFIRKPKRLCQVFLTLNVLSFNINFQLNY